jgi:hypothetical protein
MNYQLCKILRKLNNEATRTEQKTSQTEIALDFSSDNKIVERLKNAQVVISPIRVGASTCYTIHRDRSLVPLSFATNTTI